MSSTTVGDLSRNFSRAEFRDKRTGAVLVDGHLVEHLEKLRAMIGRPLRIVSGYRSPSTNRAVGGARRSQHLYGRAADIPFGYCTPAQARAAGFTGIGVRGRYAVHVDVRPGPPATWQY